MLTNETEIARSAKKKVIGSKLVTARKNSETGAVDIERVIELPMIQKREKSETNGTISVAGGANSERLVTIESGGKELDDPTETNVLEESSPTPRSPGKIKIISSTKL